MSEETIKLSHIILYVDKTIPERDVMAFCTNIRSEEPQMGFTYLCYDNRFTPDGVEALVNLINSMSISKRSLFIITDSKNALMYASDQGIANAAVFAKGGENRDLSGALYCIEDIGFMDHARINRMWQRHHKIPWTIATTDRLVIREQTMEDIDSLYKLYDDDDIRRFVEPLYEDRKKEEEYLRDYIDNQYRFYEYGLWALTLKDTGELIGRAGIGSREGYDIPELGYVIGKRFRRKGYATEALRAIIVYGCEELGFDRYMAFTSQRNIPSVKLLERMGFLRAGCDEIMGRLHDRYLLTKTQ